MNRSLKKSSMTAFSTLESGQGPSDTDVAYRYGLTVLDLKAFSSMTASVDGVELSMQMVTYT